MHAQKCISRRGILAAGAALAVRSAMGAATDETMVTFAAIADPQYADRDDAMGRAYRQSLRKLQEAVKVLAGHRPAFAVMMGDLLDKWPSRQAAAAAAAEMHRAFEQAGCPCRYVLGNHDVDQLSRQQFMKITGMPAGHYSFDCGGVHFVVLDGCYRKDFTPYEPGNFTWLDSWLSPGQIEWLAGDLNKARGPVVVFVHQRLDDDQTNYGIRNAPDARRVLEESRRVIAVFQGHYHKGDMRRIAGIPYITLRGMVEGAGMENTAYALVSICADGTVRVRGFGKQPDYELKPAKG